MNSLNRKYAYHFRLQSSVYEVNNIVMSLGIMIRSIMYLILCHYY